MESFRQTYLPPQQPPEVSDFCVEQQEPSVFPAPQQPQPQRPEPQQARQQKPRRPAQARKTVAAIIPMTAGSLMPPKKN